MSFLIAGPGAGCWSVFIECPCGEGCRGGAFILGQIFDIKNYESRNFARTESCNFTQKPSHVGIIDTFEPHRWQLWQEIEPVASGRFESVLRRLSTILQLPSGHGWIAGNSGTMSGKKLSYAVRIISIGKSNSGRRTKTRELSGGYSGRWSFIGD